MSFFPWHLGREASVFCYPCARGFMTRWSRVGFFGFWPPGAFCLIWRNFQFAGISSASPSHVTAVATLVADGDFALWHLTLLMPHQCQRCLTELPDYPAKCTACPWHDIKKSCSHFFLSPLQPSVCYFYLVQLLQEEAVLPLWTVETCSSLLWASRFQMGTAVPWEDLVFKMVTFDLPHGTSVMVYSSGGWKMKNRNNTIIPNSMTI